MQQRGSQVLESAAPPSADRAQADGHSAVKLATVWAWRSLAWLARGAPKSFIKARAGRDTRAALARPGDRAAKLQEVQKNYNWAWFILDSSPWG